MHDLSHVLADLYGVTSVLVALYDDQDRLRYANPAFRAAYYLDPAETPSGPISCAATSSRAEAL